MAWLAKVRDFCLPSFCVICYFPGTLVCPRCLAKIEVYHPTKPKPGFSFYKYSALTSKLLKKAKYRSFSRVLIAVLEQIPLSLWLNLRDYLKHINNPWLTFVPMTKSDQQIRGFNQAEILARFIAARLKLPYFKLLVKRNQNQKQAMLKGYLSRQANVRGVYSLCSGVEIKERDIVLVDDVITTGATVKEIASILKKGGAKRVVGVSLFRGG